MLNRLVAWVAAALAAMGGVEGARVAPSPTPTLVKIVETETGGSWAYDFWKVSTGESIELVYNYENRANSEKLVSDHNCRMAINGGFYDENFRPLGLVILQSVQWSKHRPNKLFNGYVYTRSDNSLGVTDRPMYAGVKDVLQTGPLLVYAGRTMDLAKGQKSARRMLAIELDDGSAVFVTVFGRESRLDGPVLSDLPKVLEAIAVKEGWGVANAVNLDGGAASVFYSSFNEFREWQPVGSLWCLK